MASKRKRQKSLLNYFSTASVAPSVQQPVVVHNSEEAKAMNVDEDKELNETKSKQIVNNDQEQDIPPQKIKESTTPVIFEESDSDEEAIVKPKRKHRLKKKRIIDDEDSEDDSISFRENLKQQEMEQCDDDDDGRIIHDEELTFLDKSDILQERTRGKQVSRYTEALKKLADRKSKLDSYQGEKGPIEKYSLKTTIQLDDSEEEEEQEELDYILSEDNEDMDDFIVDDDIIDGEKNFGTAQNSEMTSIMMEMPAEFSRTRTQSFSKQLAIYIEYLIVLSSNPIFDISTNSKYRIAKDTVIRRVASYKDSMVTSDVWLPFFKEAMDAYFNWTFLPTTWDISLKTCEACRANKPAKYKIMLNNQSEELQEADEDKEIFYVGSECCRKGEMYHQFNHFELHMYNKVKAKVEQEEEAVNYALNNKNNNNNNHNKQDMMHKKLIQSGYIRKLKRDVKELFNTVISVYNLKHQRRVYNDDSSSSSNEEEE